MGVLIERFMELEVQNCLKVHDIFYRVSKQYDELDAFYTWCRSTGIARSSEYPEVEKISHKKLDLMDEFIRDKEALAENRKSRSVELEESVVVEPKEPEPVEEDMNAIKALPAPEGWEAPVEAVEVEEEEEHKPEEEVKKESNNTQEEGDLLHLADDAVTSTEHGNQLALALFDGGAAANPPPGPAWEAFSVNDAADWETALVQSASGLSQQKSNLGGGFDMLLLDGMYQQATVAKASTGGTFGASGSASSMAFGSVGRPAMLALPAPPTSNNDSAPSTRSADPFAASLGVAPPSYVQMSEMEKKQKLLMEEQLLWQQYARDGMPGHLGMPKLQGSPYNNGGYTQSY